MMQVVRSAKAENDCKFAGLMIHLPRDDVGELTECE